MLVKPLLTAFLLSEPGFSPCEQCCGSGFGTLGQVGSGSVKIVTSPVLKLDRRLNKTKKN
jgi:hypothetical protein